MDYTMTNPIQFPNFNPGELSQRQIKFIEGIKMTSPRVIHLLAWSAQIRAHEDNIKAITAILEVAFEDMYSGEITIEDYKKLNELGEATLANTQIAIDQLKKKHGPQKHLTQDV